MQGKEEDPLRWLVTGAGGQLGSHVVRHLRRYLHLATTGRSRSGPSSVEIGDTSSAIRGGAKSLPAAVQCWVLQSMPRGCGGGGVTSVSEDASSSDTSAAALERGRGVDVQCKTVDITDEAAVQRTILAFRPQVVVHTAAITAVGAAFKDPQLCSDVNVAATGYIAAACAEVGAVLLYVSTDMVFDGTNLPLKGYNESCTPAPLSVYGTSKLQGEQEAVSRSSPSDGCAATTSSSSSSSALVVRVPLMYGVADSTKTMTVRGTFQAQWDALAAGTGSEVVGFRDEYRTPTSYSAAASALIALGWLRFQQQGAATTSSTSASLPSLLHVGGPARVSRCDLLRVMQDALGDLTPTTTTTSSRGAATIVEKSRNDFPGEPRAEDLSLDSSAVLKLLRLAASGDATHPATTSNGTSTTTATATSSSDGTQHSNMCRLVAREAYDGLQQPLLDSMREAVLHWREVLSL